MAARKRRNPYSVHPAVGMATKWAGDLAASTGKPLQEWIRILDRDCPGTAGERRSHLRKVHGLPANIAWWIAERAADRATIVAEDADTYLAGAVRAVEEQYAGRKAALRPIYDRLLEMGLALGKDVRVSPCKTRVPFYRRHVFAEVHPTTNTRVDLHLALGDAKPAGRLERLANPSGNRVGHRIPLPSLDAVDAEVARWLRAAYDLGNESAKRKAPARVPAELAAALKRNAKARSAFEALAPGHRAEWVRFVAEAKRAETREKRAARAVERLSAGKRTTY